MESWTQTANECWPPNHLTRNFRSTVSCIGFTITHSAALVYPVLPKGIKFPSTCYYPELRGFWEDHHHETLFASKGSSQNHCPVKRRLATRMSFADPFVDANWESPSAFWCRKSLTSAASFGRHIASNAPFLNHSRIFTNTCTQVLFESTFQF